MLQPLTMTGSSQNVKDHRCLVNQAFFFLQSYGDFCHFPHLFVAFCTVFSYGKWITLWCNDSLWLRKDIIWGLLGFVARGVPLVN